MLGPLLRLLRFPAVKESAIADPTMRISPGDPVSSRERRPRLFLPGLEHCACHYGAEPTPHSGPFQSGSVLTAAEAIISRRPRKATGERPRFSKLRLRLRNRPPPASAKWTGPISSFAARSRARVGAGSPPGVAEVGLQRNDQPDVAKILAERDLHRHGPGAHWTFTPCTGSPRQDSDRSAPRTRGSRGRVPGSGRSGRRWSARSRAACL